MSKPITIALSSVFCLFTLSSSAYGESAFGYEFFEKDNYLIIIDKRDNRTIKFENIYSYDNFRVRMGVKKSEISQESLPIITNKNGTVAGPIDIPKFLQETNALFFKGETDQAMQLLLSAEKSVPDNYQIKTMLGSVFFKKGDKVKAKEYWQLSMKLNPAQPSVVKSLEAIDQEVNP